MRVHQIFVNLAMVVMMISISDTLMAQSLSEIKEAVNHAESLQFRIAESRYLNAASEQERLNAYKVAYNIDSVRRDLKSYVDYSSFNIENATNKQIRIMAKRLLNHNFLKEASDVLSAGVDKREHFCCNYLAVFAAKNGAFESAVALLYHALSDGVTPYPPSLHNLSLLMLSPKYQKIWSLFNAKRTERGKNMAESYLRYADPSYDPLEGTEKCEVMPMLPYSPDEYIEAPVEEKEFNEYIKGGHLKKLLK